MKPNVGNNTILADKRGQHGSGYELLLSSAIQCYEVLGIASFKKFGAEAAWTGPGKIHAEPGKVDYIGAVRIPGYPLAVFCATDAKATEHNFLDINPGQREGGRWVGRKVPPHQVDFLSWVDRIGGLAWWTVQFTKLRRHFVLPHAVLLQYYRPPWKIPLEVFEKEGGIEVYSTELNPLDFLAAVPVLVERKKRERRWNPLLSPLWTQQFDVSGRLN